MGTHYPATRFKTLNLNNARVEGVEEVLYQQVLGRSHCRIPMIQVG